MINPDYALSYRKFYQIPHLVIFWTKTYSRFIVIDSVSHTMFLVFEPFRVAVTCYGKYFCIQSLIQQIDVDRP